MEAAVWTIAAGARRSPYARLTITAVKWVMRSLGQRQPCRYAGSVPESGKMLTIWPGLGPLSTILVAIATAGFTAGAVSEFAAGQVAVGMIPLLTPPVLILFGWVLLRIRPRQIRLEVTENMVRARQGNWRGAPDMEAPRSEITAIHFFPGTISFRGLDNKPIMLIQPQYTVRQMRKVAAELRVTLYSHRRWLGLRGDLKIGRLVYDPASGPVS